MAKVYHIVSIYSLYKCDGWRCRPPEGLLASYTIGHRKRMAPCGVLGPLTWIGVDLCAPTEPAPMPMQEWVREVDRLFSEVYELCDPGTKFAMFSIPWHAEDLYDRLTREAMDEKGGREG